MPSYQRTQHTHTYIYNIYTLTQTHTCLLTRMPVQAKKTTHACTPVRRLVTNTNRVWSTSSGDTRDPVPTSRLQLVSPCPLGAYRLKALQGISAKFVNRINFVWAAVPGARGPLVSSANSWTCTPMLPVALRVAGRQPQCMAARAGGECLQGDCMHLKLCAESFTATRTCGEGEGSDDPTSFCTRARGALGADATNSVCAGAFAA